MAEYKGIDVSDAREKVDWEKAKAAGLDFAIIRCGYGMDEQGQDDEEFERNTSECERLGIPYGVYFYSYALSVKGIDSEVKHVLRLLKGKRPSYPIYFDMEDADGYKRRHGMPSKQTITDMVKAFCEAMEDKGYFVGWYANLDWCNNYMYPEQLTPYTFWYARPGVSKPDKQCDLWQKEIGSTGGKWPGVNGYCDLNISYKDFPSIIRSIGANGFKKEESVPQPSPKNYTIKYGDTLYGIAASYGMSLAQLISYNPHIQNPNLIHPGQVIYLTGKASAPAPSGKPVKGQRMALRNVPLYNASDSKSPSGYISGTYFLWDGSLINGRYRITNTASRVGMSGQITGYIDKKYV